METVFIITVSSAYQKKVMARKLFKKFGYDVESTNSTKDFWKVSLILTEDVTDLFIATVRGYAIGILEWIESVEQEQ